MVQILAKAESCLEVNEYHDRTPSVEQPAGKGEDSDWPSWAPTGTFLRGVMFQVCKSLTFVYKRKLLNAKNVTHFSCYLD